ncbi:EAL domain-containing response regulator [Thaumasiovibrio subtropicus]|uniref:EAL domain-containing response regulator n=1 Tax=Thaumasiovibrio subtropicus TaxID=1891207 RepID=UPI000B35D08E|nr:EAL domain-containing response regulator [Thaumasiovibrio subtropicus]
MQNCLERILIVDDQSVIRFALKTALQTCGDYDLVEAKDGCEAKDLINEKDFELIFCDLNMPNESGIDVLQHLAERAHTHPIVMISGEGEPLLNACSLLAKQFNLNILGVAEKPIQRQTIATFLSAAEETLNRDNRRSIPKLSEKDVELAINEHRVVAYFQPQIELRENTIHCVEVLARLKTHNNNTLLPASFIPVAESNPELINKLTKSVILDALEKFQRLKERHPTILISINLSASMMDDQSFPMWLSQTCFTHNVKAGDVTCELTETAICNHPALLTASILRLSLLKFNLSIDDFGTGYASMQQLHALPFQELKIDKSFVKDCMTNLKSKAVIEQTIKLAKALNMTVVAEGVENEAVAHYLQQLHCDVAQGYYYAPPLSIRALLFSDSANMHWPEG